MVKKYVKIKGMTPALVEESEIPNLMEKKVKKKKSKKEDKKENGND